LVNIVRINIFEDILGPRLNLVWSIKCCSRCSRFEGCFQCL